MNHPTNEDNPRQKPPGKAYRPPRLRRYGDVRDLTMGSSQLGTTESSVFRKEETGI